MGRRRNENVFEMLLDVPWWVGVIVAILFYVGFAHIMPAMLKKNEISEIVAPMLPLMGKGFAALALIAAGVSGLRSLFSGGGRKAESQHRVPPSREPESKALGCPLCGQPMVVRLAKKGDRAGSSFLGCSRYPECRGTRDLAG